MVEVREARYFIAVAEELHFGRAAERLHMTQPPLSAAVRTLETRLGVDLLHRTTRTVRLTPAGVAFLDKCREVIGASRAADEAARRVALGQSGELRVGAVTSAITDFLPAALSHHSAAHPQVSVRVDEMDTDDAAVSLSRRTLDLALVRLLSPPPHCRREVLRDEPFALAVPPMDRAPQWWPSGANPDGDLTGTRDLPWIWLPRAISPDYHDQVATCCRASGFVPEPTHTARSITSQLAMVASGLGVAVVPESAITQIPSIRGYPLRNSPTITLAAVWRRDTDALVANLIASIRATIVSPRMTHG